MENMKIYEAVRTPPINALRPIQAGRLKGKTDINPMWRIKALTEQFGPCGIGWKYEIIKEWLEPGANGEIAAFVDIDLFVKVEGKWSEAIPGTGGSMFVVKENKGLYTDDEAFKKALTDAISVSCKALGIGADVYWEQDSTKYSERPQNRDQNDPEKAKPRGNTREQLPAKAGCPGGESCSYLRRLRKAGDCNPGQERREYPGGKSGGNIHEEIWPGALRRVPGKEKGRAA